MEKINFWCIYSLKQYKLNLGFESYYIHLIILILRSPVLRWHSWTTLALSTSFTVMLFWILLKSDINLVICLLYRPTSSTCVVVIVVLTGLGAHSFQPYSVLGEVSRQSGVVHLLHVLLNFRFGVFEQIGLTLGRRKRGGMKKRG